MRRTFSLGVTLIEALMVAFLFVVIAGLAYNQLWKANEKARIRGAWAILRLIDGAQQAYLRDHTAFANNLGDLRDAGYIDDPDVGQSDWNYSDLTDNTQAVAKRLRGSCQDETLTRVYGTGRETDTFANCGL